MIYFVALGLPFKRSVWQAGRAGRAGSTWLAPVTTQLSTHRSPHTHTHAHTDRQKTRHMCRQSEIFTRKALYAGKVNVIKRAQEEEEEEPLLASSSYGNGHIMRGI